MPPRAIIAVLVCLGGVISAGEVSTVVVSGEVAAERGASPPKSVRGMFVDADGKDAAETSTRCSLENWAWRCSVPAGRAVHLRLEFDDYAPIYIWDVDRELDAGIHTLVRGASVVGRVIDPKATLTLVPLTAANQPAADRALTSLKTKLDAKGRFRFTNVPPGEYRLIARVAGRGDAVRQVEVTKGRELRLTEPLMNPALAGLEVFLTPPVTKAGRQWRLQLKRPGERLQEMLRVAEGVAGVDGVWGRDGLQPGVYLLIVSDVGSEVAHELVDLRGGPERLLLSVAGIDVSGRLTSGGKPIAATVQFDLIGAPSRRVQAETDEDGSFAATFPVAGDWLPWIFGNAVDFTLPSVTIRSPHDEELLLELPGGRLKATVLDTNGVGAPADVKLRKDGKAIVTGFTDDDGRVELFGIEEGTYNAEAETELGFAGPVPITIGEDETAELELRVNPVREVTGQVLTDDGLPASGAVVRTLDDVAGTYHDTIADGRGMFKFRVKPGVDSVDVVVIAPPHPVALRRISAGATRNASTPPIVLSRTGATLRVMPNGNIPPWPTLRAPHGRSYALVHLLAPLFGRPVWREYVDGAFQFSVEPGAYVLCSPDSKCRSALLAPNAETLITFEETS
jgi:hypothetical protein